MRTTLEYANRSKKRFEQHLKPLKTSNEYEEQKRALSNINTFCDARKDIINLFDDFNTIASESIFKAKKPIKGN